MRKRCKRVIGRVLLIAIVLGLGGGFAGCSGEEEGSVVEKKSPLYYLSTGLWNHKIIDVCFETSGYDTEKTWLRQVLKGQRSWEETGKLVFNFVGMCAPGATGLHVVLESLDYSSTIGPVNDLVTVHLMTADRVDCPARTYGWDLTPEECFKRTALHEFGHAIGLSHEANRADKPADCTAESGTNLGDTTVGTFDLSSIMITWGGTCAPVDNLSGLDRTGIARVYGNRDGDVPHLGDFDGDGRDDMLCHDTVNGSKWVDLAEVGGQFSGADWSTGASWCNHDTGKLLKGDFDGDHRIDLMCLDVASGDIWIDYASTTGQFGGTDWYSASSLCGGNREAQIYVGDFNGDQRDDLFCLFPSYGLKSIDFADINGHFGGVDWSRFDGWCSQSTGRLFVGDFTGEGRSDLLCFDISTGAKQFDYADINGHLDGTDWSSSTTWCSRATGELIIGDFNGDHRDDLLCHDVANGSKWIDYADTSGHFTGTNWSSTAIWCVGGQQRLYVGDVDGDMRDDFLCHDTRTGDKWIDLADTAGQFGGTDFYRAAQWCNHDAGILR